MIIMAKIDKNALDIFKKVNEKKGWKVLHESEEIILKGGKSIKTEKEYTYKRGAKTIKTKTSTKNCSNDDISMLTDFLKSKNLK